MNYYTARLGLFLSVLSAGFISNAASASEIFTLPDGRHVQLNDDFTWQYLAPEKAMPKSKPSKVIQPVEVSTPSATMSTTAVIAQNKNEAVLNLGEPSLKLSDSGIEIQLDAARYEDGQVIIPTTISNKSRNAVVDIEIEITLTDANGHVLAQEQVTVFRAIKRMAETYLRPKQVVTGLDIQLNSKQAPQYHISAQIIEIENN